MALLKRLLCPLPGLILMLAAPALQAGEIITYVHTDHLGSPVLETDASGQIVRHEVYGPYGDAQISPGDDNIGYTGHVQDGDTGLVYMQARYYDPVIGRFLSTDPVTFGPNQPQQFNRYWYANGNPYLYTDPDGREPGDFAAGFAMGLMFNEEQAGQIVAAEAACQVCGPGLSDGIAAGQATGALLENGFTVQGVALVVASVGGKKKGTAGGSRAGKPFTAKGKAEIDAANAERNGGANICENCGTEVVPGQRSQAGVTPPGNERQRDHIIPKSKGGDGDPSNGQVLCRNCNIDKSDK